MGLNKDNAITVTGHDPSLSNWGWCKALVCPDTHEIEIVKIGLVETKPSKIKSARKSNDDLQRGRLISTQLILANEGSSILTVEVPHGSQSARAMASYGICIGLLSSVIKPMIELSERDNKLNSIGIRTASKEEMIEWATDLYPSLPWFQGKAVAGQYAQKNEHIADAIATVHSSLTDPLMKFMLATRVSGEKVEVNI